MSLEADLAELMTEQVTIQYGVTKDAYGKRAFANTVTAKARLVFEVNRRVDMQGREVIEVGKAILYGAYPLPTAECQITLPDGSQPAVIAVDTVKDAGGADYYTTIRFGR